MDPEVWSEQSPLRRALSYNISGGSARHQKVKPKPWRIFTSADSQILVVLPLANRDPRLQTTISPPWFLKKKPETLPKVYIKNIKKKCRVFAWFHDATIL
jgi:hypothetical protein